MPIVIPLTSTGTGLNPDINGMPWTWNEAQSRYDGSGFLIRVVNGAWTIQDDTATYTYWTGPLEAEGVAGEYVPGEGLGTGTVTVAEIAVDLTVDYTGAGGQTGDTLLVEAGTVNGQPSYNGALDGGMTELQWDGVDTWELKYMGWLIFTRTDVNRDGVYQPVEEVTTGNPVVSTYGVSGPVTHTITASAGTGGEIDPSGAVPVEDEADQAFTITPAAHYRVDDVLVDDVSVGAVTSHEFENVTEDHTIEASFALIQHTITPSATGDGSITPGEATVVNETANQSFVCLAEAFNYISELLVDGADVEEAVGLGYYVVPFTGVADDHTIAVTFTAFETEPAAAPGKTWRKPMSKLLRSQQVWSGVETGESPYVEVIECPGADMLKVQHLMSGEGASATLTLQEIPGTHGAETARIPYHGEGTNLKTDAQTTSYASVFYALSERVELTLTPTAGVHSVWVEVWGGG